MNPADAFIRIEKGSADPDELAALTVVLLARAAELSAAESGQGPGGPGGPDGPARTPVRWRRRERRSGHRTAPGWRAGGPAHGAGAAT